MLLRGIRSQDDVRGSVLELDGLLAQPARAREHLAPRAFAVATVSATQPGAAAALVGRAVLESAWRRLESARQAHSARRRRIKQQRQQQLQAEREQEARAQRHRGGGAAAVAALVAGAAAGWALARLLTTAPAPPAAADGQPGMDGQTALHAANRFTLPADVRRSASGVRSVLCMRTFSPRLLRLVRGPTRGSSHGAVAPAARTCRAPPLRMRQDFASGVVVLQAGAATVAVIPFSRLVGYESTAERGGDATAALTRVRLRFKARRRARARARTRARTRAASALAC